MTTAATAHRRSALPFRVEFARQLSQWRVRGVLLVLGLLPVVIRLAFLIGGGAVEEERTDLASFAQVSGTTFAAFVLVVTAGFLLTLVTAVLFGDMIAGEASRSTLKYLLTIPVPRTRLLLVKAGVAFSLLALGITLLAAVSLVVGLISYGPDGLQTPVGPQLDLGESLARIAAGTALIIVRLLWAGALGLLFSVITDAPLGAAGGVVVTSIVSSILERIEDLRGIRAYLPTWNSDSFRQLFAARIDYTPVVDSLLSTSLYALVFLLAAVWWFRRKDVSS